jgi:transglutaminase-like putative cysteine protease
MRYRVSHTTTYTYSSSVRLQPHVVRLLPRSDSWQTLTSYSLLVKPTPQQQSHYTDLDGNHLVKLWFPPDFQTDSLTVQLLSQVETHKDNPFDYLLEPWALYLPIDYPASLLQQLQPYLNGQYIGFSGSIDPIAIQLAQEHWLATLGNTTQFLWELNQRIYRECNYLIRETGDPQLPGLTWSLKSGSCRDYAVLFAEVCRAIGLAARFVSGYQEGDPDGDEYHLHAWVEVYLPGAGWRGYDPTHGLVVSDRHIALVASANHRYAAPLSGTVAPAHVQAELAYQLLIQGQPSNGTSMPDQSQQLSSDSV